MWRSKPFLRRGGLPHQVAALLEEWAGVLLALGIALLLLATLKAQVARAAEFPTDVGAGTLLFKSTSGFDAAAPLSTDVEISVAGVVARVKMAQRFRNPGTGFVEAVYVMPLPDDAAVDRLRMQIGDRIVEGEIHERARAERIYGEARAAGQRTSLVRQTSANLFTTAVANIGPGETIDIAIEYLQTARYDAGEFSLRLPLTLTPRYGDTDTPEGRDARQSAVLPEPTITIEPGTTAAARAAHEASVRAVLAPGMPLADIGGRGHELNVRRERGGDRRGPAAGRSLTRGAAQAGALVRPPAGDRYLLEPVTPRVPMDRDLVITWRPEVGVAPAVAALTETRDGTTYALLMILPPADAHATRSQPREQIFVVDTSGSMGGQSIVQARAALKDALGRLRGADRFNVIQFNSVTSALFEAPVPFTSSHHDAAVRYVNGLEATGGTEIGAAINTALAQPVTPGFVRQVIFITDGAVGAETQLFTTIKQGLGAARLFTVGIGSAPNSNFMRKAAQFGRGTYTHIGDTSEVTAKMQALFTKLERVALADVVVDWPEAVELYPHQIPDVYAGEPLVLAASFPAVPDRPLLTTAFGQADGQPWSQTVAGVPSTLPGIATLWARRKIEHLIDSRIDGIDEAVIRAQVVATALEHNLVSPYTSLVAVDKTPARSAAALERRDVTNSVPAGAQWTAALPRTATPAELYRALGALLLLAGAMFRWRRHLRIAITRFAVVGAVVAGTTMLAAGLWMPAKAELAQVLLNRAWHETQAGHADVRPWPWADTWPVARLTLPGAYEPLTVLAGASGRNLAFAPALMDGSALPGTHGVSVIAGHRDTHFETLAELAVGDTFTIDMPDGARYTYEVTALDVIDSERAMLRLDADESLVALVTCWPFDAVTTTSPWRYVVSARRVPEAGVRS